MTRYRFELAEPGDDAALRRLMAQTPMDGRVLLSFQREPNYFDANCVLGRNRQTIVCRDIEQNEIVGLGTRSIREMYIAGRTTRVGYLSGLRIAERARKQDVLARGYRFLRELHEADPHAPDFYLTTIAEDNAVAIDQLTSRRAGLPTYHQLSRLHTLVLPIRSRPVHSKLESPATCRVSQADDIQEVVEFLNTTGPQKTFFPMYQRADFEQLSTGTEITVVADAASVSSDAGSIHHEATLIGAPVLNATFRGLQTSSICVATRSGRIIGTAGIWNQQAFRQTVVSDYQPVVRRLRPLLNSWSRLTGGIQLPAIGSSLGAAFVCFPVVSVNEPAVFAALLRQLMRIAPEDVQYLLLGLCDDDPWLPFAQSLSRSQYTTRLYAVNWSAIPASVVGPSAKPYYLELGCL